MKKWIAIALLVVMVIGLTACGPINKNDVAIVWYINDKATNPNDAINSMERAMYIENIAYKHYGAGGSAAIQLEMAQSALASGCAALMVEIRDNSVAQDLVNVAKGYDIPIILFNHAVDQEIVASYDKC
jgi:ABC-type sugar transport system substrate-binding protein